MRVFQDNRAAPGAVSDENLSFAFLTFLESAYGGMWAFERALTVLDADLDREDETARAEHVLERVQNWRRDLHTGSTLFALGGKPLLDGDASRAWRLLHVAEARLRSLITEVIGSSDVEVLQTDDFARNVRIAALVECTRADEVLIRGMIDWMETIGDVRAADNWRQRLLASAVRAEEADRWLATFRELRGEPEADLLAQFLDDTLLLAAVVAERVVDLCHTFSLYTGVFEFTDVGIPTEQIDAWHAGGFSAREAGRWFAAGHTPATAVQWLAVGASDPMVAASFMWRGFSPAEAGPWLRRHIGGRMAAAWAGSGHDPEDAREWIALGIPEPHVLAKLPVREARLM